MVVTSVGLHLLSVRPQLLIAGASSVVGYIDIDFFAFGYGSIPIDTF